MELSSMKLIPAPQQRVWDALNDPDALKSCIPGCEDIESLSPTEFRVVLLAKVGPVTARFNGKMHITDSNPPNSYSLTFEGQGGMAGFAKGGADVVLRSVQGGTELSYIANAKVGGKLAQIGSRLVDIAAKKTADDFFATFVATVGLPDSEAEGTSEAPIASIGGYRRFVPWAIPVVAVLLIAIFWFR